MKECSVREEPRSRDDPLELEDDQERGEHSRDGFASGDDSNKPTKPDKPEKFERSSRQKDRQGPAKSN
jgi:hypothetical protein